MDNMDKNCKKENIDVGVLNGDSNVANSSHSSSHHSSHHSGHHHSHHGSHHSSHHGGHHGSHHGSHKRRRSSSSKKKKLNINTKVAGIVAIVLMVLLTAFVITFELTHYYKGADGNQQAGELSAGILQVEVINKNGVLVNSAVERYLGADLTNPIYANSTPSSFANSSSGRLDAQIPMGLKLSIKEGNALSYRIELADNELYENAKVYYLEASSGTVEFKHLYTNATYYYRVTVYTKNGTDAISGTFLTADTPRILSIDGLSNVRDIGNWKTDSGKRIKQGLLFRGTEMDGAVESGYHLTNAGLIDMLDILGIKTDIDLRAQTPLSKDALGSRVEHKYYNMLMYKDVFTMDGKEKMRAVFVDLANPDNYPIYLHCSYGTDRTGTVCYILEALLGVSKTDCRREYGLSNVKIEYILAVEEGLMSYGGGSLKENAELYLLDCGITTTQIESIRNIFLGD